VLKMIPQTNGSVKFMRLAAAPSMVCQGCEVWKLVASLTPTWGDWLV
jgi:hypothetical protein